MFKGLAYGDNQAANQQAQMVDNSPPYDPAQEFQPADNTEAFLYGPTDRPSEPVTAGAPFGPGPDAPLTAAPTPQQFVQNVIATIPQDSLDPEVAAFARRVAQGL